MAIPPPPQLNNWTFRRVVSATLILILVALGFWLLYQFYEVIFILFVAIILGTTVRPLVTWLDLRGLPRIVGIILISLTILALLIGFVMLLFPLIFEQGVTIAAAVPGYYQGLREWMIHHPNLWIVGLSEFLPPTLPSLAPVQQTGQQVLASAEVAVGFMNSVANIILIATAILLITFHWTFSDTGIVHTWLTLVPKSQRKSIGELISGMEIKIGYSIAGQGVLCVIIGVMALVAYLVIGLPNALLLALLAGLLEAIPMIGPLLGAIPAGIIALSISPSKLIWVIVATIVIQLLENNFLVPRIMRKAVGVNPFVSLLAIFAFSSFFGIAGALMAIPMAVIIQLLLDRFVFKPVEIEPDASSGRNFASRLRYEAQDLAQDLRKQARLKKWGSVLRVKQIDSLMDEIETITTDLDALLAEIPGSDSA